jgi:hypothetical protein
MSDDAAPCPECARTLRMIAEPKAPCAFTHCPACGASIVFVTGASLVLLGAKAAKTWRFRGILREQGVELTAVTGTALAVGAASGVGIAFGGGVIIGAIAGIVIAAVGGAGLSSTIAMDALTGATTWRAELGHEEGLLALQPEGYRA